MDEMTTTYSVFADFQRHVHTGADLAEAVEKAREAYGTGAVQTVVLFDDATGDQTEVDPRAGVDPWPDRAARPREPPPCRQSPSRPNDCDGALPRRENTCAPS